jgi:hypothetical protein
VRPKSLDQIRSVTCTLGWKVLIHYLWYMDSAVSETAHIVDQKLLRDLLPRSQRSERVKDDHPSFHSCNDVPATLYLGNRAPRYHACTH